MVAMARQGHETVGTNSRLQLEYSASEMVSTEDRRQDFADCCRPGSPGEPFTLATFDVSRCCTDHAGYRLNPSGFATRRLMPIKNRFKEIACSSLDVMIL
jgi:hypothetical protein